MSRELASELEDHLQQFKFHTNGLRPGEDITSALGAYMGILHYDRIQAAIATRNNREEWLAAVEVWEHDHESTGSPSFGLLARWVRRIVAPETLNEIELLA